MSPLAGQRSGDRLCGRVYCLVVGVGTRQHYSLNFTSFPMAVHMVESHLKLI